MSNPINPSTGLPMIDRYGGVDVGGSPYGVHSHPWSASFSFTGEDY